MDKKLQAEFDFYLKNQSKLVEQYNGKYIVIKGNDILGSYDSSAQAYEETLKDNELGTFLIQYCIAGSDSYTQVFHSRVLV